MGANKLKMQQFGKTFKLVFRLMNFVGDVQGTYTVIILL